MPITPSFKKSLIVEQFQGNHLMSFTLFTVKTITKLNLGLGDKFEIKFKNLAAVVHVLRTTQKLVISRWCFAEGGIEMYQEL